MLSRISNRTGSRICALAMTVTLVFSAWGAGSIPFPGVPPVIPGEAPIATPDLEATLRLLRSGAFAEREQAVRRLARIGDVALPALERLRDDASRDEAWWIGAAMQEIRGRQKPDPPQPMGGIMDLLAAGPVPETMSTLRSLGASRSATLVDRFARQELGFDCLYSMRPRQVLPRAVQLLQVQTEPYYKLLLLRLIRGVLGRTLLPLPDSAVPAIPAEGVDFMAENPGLAAALAAELESPSEPVRLEALRAMALGHVALPAEARAELRAAGGNDAAELRRLRGAFRQADDDRNGGDDELVSWIAVCCDALNQDHDELAQLGAYNALSHLVPVYPSDLTAALLKQTGRARDTLAYLLGTDAFGRAMLLRADVDVPGQLPASLARVEQLCQYDLFRRGLNELLQGGSKGAACLAWADLVNDEAARYYPLSAHQAGKTFRNKSIAQAVEPLGISHAREGTTHVFSRTALFRKPEEYLPWYEACGTGLLSTRFWIVVGATSGVLASDVAGARVLTRMVTAFGAAPFEVRGGRHYVRDLFLLHPCVGLLPDSELDPELRDLWEQRAVWSGMTFRSVRDAPYPGPQHHVPLALWGYMSQNDCPQLTAFGLFLGRRLGLRHAPLLTALLRENTRMAGLLETLNAEVAVPAVLRDVLARQERRRLSYDHDLFSAVAHFSIADAIPACETYAKRNSCWPAEGVKAVAGYTMARHSPGSRSVPGTPDPLWAGALREILDHCRQERLNKASQLTPPAEKGLFLMGVTGAAEKLETSRDDGKGE